MRISFRREMVRRMAAHHRSADTGLGNRRIEIGVARDEEEAILAARQRKRTREHQRLEEAEELKRRNVTLPQLKWMQR